MVYSVTLTNSHLKKSSLPKNGPMEAKTDGLIIFYTCCCVCILILKSQTPSDQKLYTFEIRRSYCELSD